MKTIVIRRLVSTALALIFPVWQAAGQTLTGTNLPGTYHDYPVSAGPTVANLAISVEGTAAAYSHLLLKAGGAPSGTNYDFIASINGTNNAINLELPELAVTNYVLRVSTPAGSLAHAYTVTVATNVGDLRSANRPATKSIYSTNSGTAGAGVWHYYRVEISTNVTGWRVLLSGNTALPDLYVQRNQLPSTTSFLKRSMSQTNDIVGLLPEEASPGAYFIGVYQPSGSGSYTLRTELITITTLTWDSGATHLGTQVYTNLATNNVDSYFKITAQNTSIGAWRTALNVVTGEAAIYLARASLPSMGSNSFKSDLVGSDGFVLPSSAFNAGEDWYYLVRATPGSQWSLLTGEAFMADLGTVATNDSSGSGSVPVGAEGMRFFRTTVPPATLAWRLWLNGLTNSILVRTGAVPVASSADLRQSGQLLVVPDYLVGGKSYFIGVSALPGTLIQLDSRQQPVTDIPFLTQASFSVSGYGYATYRIQVPVDQLVWQLSSFVTNGNPNLAVRRGAVPNESYNSAYSEAAGAATDSILLVPPTLSDGTFYITLYGSNTFAGTLHNGTPEVTDINFESVTTNTDTNRVGWRLFRVSDIAQQVGHLGWDLFLTNAAPGTRIALRKNGAPGIWNYRNPNAGSLGTYDFLSTATFLQRPGHQADVWYVGVYNPTNALGNFTLISRPLTADTVTFNGGSALRTNVPPGKWQFFRVDVPDNILGWDVRVTEVTGGSPQLVVRRELLPISLSGIGFSGVVTATNWPGGNQWVAGSDWTGRDDSTDGNVDESGRILTMGYGRPLVAATYYVGVFSPLTSSAEMTYTLLSRGIGESNAIPVQDLDYVSTNYISGLPARDIAVYRINIPTNTPSWKVKLTPVTGDAVLALARGALPNITAGNSGSVTNPLTAGKKMAKAGNEHFVQLPPANQSYLVAGTYYLLVASDGLANPAEPTRIGPGSANLILNSVGPMPELDLGLLETNDLVYTSTLEGGDSLAFHFSNLPWPETLGFELSLSNTTGNPVMISRGTEALANPGASSSGSGVTADLYGNEGGQNDALVAHREYITVSDPFDLETVMLKARATNSVYGDASYTLRIRKLVASPLAFDGGICEVTNQTHLYEYFKVEVPTNALGWDIRLTNVVGSPVMIICRDFLALYSSSIGWNPGASFSWSSGSRWNAEGDWTQRSYSEDGSENQDGRILAMGMGYPLEPGTYYVGIHSTNATEVGVSYTLVSRGIGDEFSIPVLDVPFAGGAVTNLGLLPREAAYYRMVVPTNATSWRAKLTTTEGESLLLLMTNYLPNILCGQTGARGKMMQKTGDEHLLLLPANGEAFLRPGTNYLAVAGEGLAEPLYPARIGPGTNRYVLETFGVLTAEDMGEIGNIEVTRTNWLEGGSVCAYRFTVPEGTVSLEVQLRDVTNAPAMVLRQGAAFPNPGAGSVGSGPGSVSTDAYGNEGGQNISSTTGDARSTFMTRANPTNGIYTIMVKARGNVATYSNACFTLGIRALNYQTVDFDGGTTTVTNHTSGSWKYFRVDVPTNAMGWDVRLTNVLAGLPRISVRRDLVPSSLSTTPWSAPGNSLAWPSGSQWAAVSDWTRRDYNAAYTIYEEGRILAMGAGQPLEPGTYYVGVINQTGTNLMSYTLSSRGFGEGYTIPVTDLAFNGGTVVVSNQLPREAAYYRVHVPSNCPGWKVRLTATVGEAMLLVLSNHVPNVDSGRSSSTLSGRCMQKAGSEHYLMLPTYAVASQTNIVAGDYYLAVISEGMNPASFARIGTGSSSYILTSEGEAPVMDLGAVGASDLVNSNTLGGGETRLYRFTIPETVKAVELRLENRVGNPVLMLSSDSLLPNPGGTADTYGTEGGTASAGSSPDILTMANPEPGTYALAIKARASGGLYLDSSYKLVVRHIPVPELNFTAEFNTNGLSNVGSGVLINNQRAYYRVTVPTNVWDRPVIGWELDLSQVSGAAALRVRKGVLPSDTFAEMPSASGMSVIAPPFLTNGTWYIEVRGTNSTSYTLASSSLALRRPAWQMPAAGATNTTPGLTDPAFADTGVDTNGLPLAGDQGVDLQQGKYHFYAVSVPPGNGGLMRLQMDAVSGNADLYIRTNMVPTYSHRSTGGAGSTVNRTLTGSGTEYANWVPLSGLSETGLTPGLWYLAVRAASTSNARYRLRLSTGNVQDLAMDGGSATNQALVTGDWRYYRVQIPPAPPAYWHVTFNQLAGDSIFYVRDVVPPGNGTNIANIRDWESDGKNSGPYDSYDLPDTYTFSVPPLRPGTVYYLGFRAKSDSTFSVSSSVSGSTNPLPPIIEFYGGSVTNTLPAHGLVTYRILTPEDALRWRHTSTHSNLVQVYLENGTYPTRSASDDFRSTAANSSQDRFLTAYPWLPSQTYYLVATNTTGSDQIFRFTMNGGNTSADDDADGMPDVWEVGYWGNLVQLPNNDYDVDGVSNLNEYLEGTDPTSRGSFRARLIVLSTNGVVIINPVSTNSYALGSDVSLTAVPNPGYNFVSWGGSASGSANPLALVMDTNKTLIPRFRVPADDFDQRIALSGFTAAHSGLLNTNATKEPGEPNHAGNQGGKSLWFTWTAPASAAVTISTEGTSFRNMLAVYVGSLVNSLTVITNGLAGAGTNTTTVTFNAVAGTIYQIAVDGYNTAAGTVAVSLTQAGAPAISSPARQGDGLFHFTITSGAGAVLTVEATTNLNCCWTNIAVVTNTTGTMDFADHDSPNFPTRFYRIALGVQGNVAPPQMVALSSAQALPDGNFRFTVTGNPGQVFRIEAATDLAPASWTNLATLINSNGTTVFTDLGSTNYSQRFYRARVLAATAVYTNFVRFVSSAGDWIGQGTNFQTSNPADIIVAHGYTTNDIRVTIFSYGDYDTWFFPPIGSQLAVGYYGNATENADQTTPGIRVLGPGRGCDSCGEFNLLEFQMNGAGQIIHLWLRFTHSCGCTMAPLVGEIRYNSLVVPP